MCRILQTKGAGAASTRRRTRRLAARVAARRARRRAGGGAPRRQPARDGMLLVPDARRPAREEVAAVRLGVWACRGRARHRPRHQRAERRGLVHPAAQVRELDEPLGLLGAVRLAAASAAPSRAAPRARARPRAPTRGCARGPRRAPRRGVAARFRPRAAPPCARAARARPPAPHSTRATALGGRRAASPRRWTAAARAPPAPPRAPVPVPSSPRARARVRALFRELGVRRLQVCNQPLDQAVAPLGVRLDAGLDAGLDAVRRRRRLGVDVHRADAVVEASSGAGRLEALHCVEVPLRRRHRVFRGSSWHGACAQVRRRQGAFANKLACLEIARCADPQATQRLTQIGPDEKSARAPP